jgi:hypothetical protein
VNREEAALRVAGYMTAQNWRRARPQRADLDDIGQTAAETVCRIMATKADLGDKPLRYLYRAAQRDVAATVARARNMLTAHNRAERMLPPEMLRIDAAAEPAVASAAASPEDEAQAREREERVASIANRLRFMAGDDRRIIDALFGLGGREVEPEGTERVSAAVARRLGIPVREVYAARNRFFAAARASRDLAAAYKDLL